MTVPKDSPPGTVPVTGNRPRPTPGDDDGPGGKAAPAGSHGIARTFLPVVAVAVFGAGFLAATLMGPLLPWGSTAEETPSGQDIARIAAVEQELATFVGRLAGIEADLADLAARAPTPDAGLDEEFAALRRALDEQAAQVAAIERVDAAAIDAEPRIAAVERRLDGLASAGNSAAIAADLLARVEGLERRLDDSAEARVDPGAGRRDERLDELERQVAAWPAQPALDAASSERLAALESAVAALAGRLDRVRSGVGSRLGRAVTALVAAAALGDATRRQAAYAGEFASLREAVADLPAFAAEPAVAALEELEAHAAAGAPTVAVLAARFGTRAPAIVRAAGRDMEAGWVSRTLERVSSVVTVRQVGDVAGDSAEARVARAEVRVSAGDLAGAARELAALEGAAAEEAAAWLASARVRLAVDRAAGLLYRTAVRSLLEAVPDE